MKIRYLKFFPLLILAACFGAFSLYLIDSLMFRKSKFAQFSVLWPGTRQTLVSLSPDKKYRVAIFHSPNFGQSNDSVAIRFQDREVSRLLYVTSINGEVGTERVIWDKDSSKFWIIGRHFVRASASNSYATEYLPDEVIYFMYDIEKKVLFCHPAEFTASQNCLTEPQELLKPTFRR